MELDLFPIESYDESPDDVNSCVVIGIYAILNMVNGKIYIGSSLSIGKRWYVHKKYRGNCRIQDDWKLYGDSAFEFRVLEECQPSELGIREQWWIDNLDTCNPNIGYNYPHRR